MVLQPEDEPNPAAWTAFLDLARDDGDVEVPFARMLVLAHRPQVPPTDSSRPAAPRETPFVCRTKMPVAVVCDDARLRCSAVDLRQHGLNVKVYEPHQTMDALIWLAIDGARSRSIIRALTTMAQSRAVSLGRVMTALKDRAATPGTVAITAERRRIARDLHDGLCNSLTGLRMRLAVLGARNHDRAIADELSALGNDVESLMHDLRTVVWGMRSGDPTWDELMAHLRGRVSELVGRPAVVELDGAAGHERVPRALALALVKRAGAGCRRAFPSVPSARGGTVPTDTVVVVVRVTDEDVHLAMGPVGGAAPTWSTALSHPSAVPAGAGHV